MQTGIFRVLSYTTPTCWSRGQDLVPGLRLPNRITDLCVQLVSTFRDVGVVGEHRGFDHFKG